ncbi:manganese efflux pump MntP family protein [bacterium]|nr:manganese efflux pump MntP family protein [bacterium]
MNFSEILLLGCGLAMDASAVSLSAACCGFASTRRATFRLSFHFGLFQFIMPVIGWFIGIRFVTFISAFDHWVAFGVLGFLGAKMIRSGLKSPSCPVLKDPSRGWELVMLSVATSIDALAVGLSLAFLDVSIIGPALVIGLITSILCVIAIQIGTSLGMLFGKRMEIVGGIVLVIVGLRILYTHLLC